MGHMINGASDMWKLTNGLRRKTIRSLPARVEGSRTVYCLEFNSLLTSGREMGAELFNAC